MRNRILMRFLVMLVLAFSTFLLITSGGWSKTINVPEDSSTIQTGINGAVDGDTVLVADGLYKGEGNRDIDFLGKRITVRSEHGAEYAIINPEGNSEDHHRGFDFHSDEELDSHLEGFTIMGGYAHDGGGISCSDGSSPRISNCIVKNNAVWWSGSGIYCRNSSPTITNCSINENEAEYGTIFIAGSDALPTIDSCDILENTAHSGGAIYCTHSFPVITHCTISGNYANYGILNCDEYSSAVVEDCNIIDNRYTSISCSYHSSPTISNCYIYNNRGVAGIMCFYYSNAKISKCIILKNGDGINCNQSSPRIDSCFIAENNADGIYCDDAYPHITNCTISANNAWGIECSQASPTIHDCEITGNVIGEPPLRGGGIYCRSCSPHIFNCLISGNETYSKGGGILCVDASPVFENCIIEENKAVDGGGIYCEGFGFPPQFINCTVCRNRAVYGGGIHCAKFQFPDIINCTIAENNADSSGGGLYSNTLPFRPNIMNSIIWNNHPEAIFVKSGNQEDVISSYSDVQDDWPGEGNIDVDPLFRDPENGDYHLMATYCGDPYDSPCIDAGHPDSLDAILDCWHGLGTERSDMGAYGGGNGGWPTAVVEHDRSLSVLPGEYKLYQNYPNPFNSQTEIGYDLPRSEIVTLRIYNVRGQLVGTLTDGLQEAGVHRVTWDAREFSSGIYCARLEAGGKGNTVKMILLK